MRIKIPFDESLQLSTRTKIRNELRRLLFGWEGFEPRIKVFDKGSTLRCVGFRKGIQHNRFFMLALDVMQRHQASFCVGLQRRENGSSTGEGNGQLVGVGGGSLGEKLRP